LNDLRVQVVKLGTGSGSHVVLDVSSGVVHQRWLAAYG